MGMKCRKQKRYINQEIASLWEVNVEEKLWRRIVEAANVKGGRCTFSWITRYCVFRLMRKKNLRMRQAMKIHSERIKTRQKSAEKHHRHILCLYGDDEKLLRLAAMQLGITVSQFIRLALVWFLPKIENSIVKWEHIFYHGTKICRYFDFTRTNRYKIPFYDKIFYEKWSPLEWWGRPDVTIPIPYTPSMEDIQKMFEG
jgi:hypothetical protein